MEQIAECSDDFKLEVEVGFNSSILNLIRFLDILCNDVKHGNSLKVLGFMRYKGHGIPDSACLNLDAIR